MSSSSTPVTDSTPPAPVYPLRMVARLPEALLAEPLVDDSDTSAAVVTGILRKQVSGRSEFVATFIELRDARLACSDHEDAARADNALDLKTATSLHPVPDVQFGMAIVAPARSWVLAADSEDDYIRWVRALTHAGVPYAAVDVAYKRMVQLQEVLCERPTDVRLLAIPSATVGKVIEHIFNCYTQALDALPLRDFTPDAFVLRIEDADRTWSELLTDCSRPFDASERVREAVTARQTLRAYLLDAEVAHFCQNARRRQCSP